MIQPKVIVALGVGFGLGYVTCLSRNEDIHEAAQAFKQFLQDQALKDDVERKKKADAEAGAKENTAWGSKEPGAEPEPEEAEVVDDHETTTAGPGETP